MKLSNKGIEEQLITTRKLIIFLIVLLAIGGIVAIVYSTAIADSGSFACNVVCYGKETNLWTDISSSFERCGC